MPRIRQFTPFPTSPTARAGDDWFAEPALRALNSPAPPRVTLVAAPPGSGRRRLVEHWLRTRPELECRWIDVEPGDRDLSAADLEELTATMKDGAPGPAGGVLVLSGLESLTVEQTVRVVEALPATGRAILLTAGAGLPAASSVRLAGELAELGPDELWWPEAAIGSRLRRLAGIEVDAAEAGQLFELTAGWPAAVLILGRALRHGSGLPAPGQAWLDPGLLDFVTAETLNRLPADLRRFVLRSCLLPPAEPGLAADLCGLLVPELNPHALLAAAAHRGLLGPTGYLPPVRAAALRALRTEHAGLEAELLGRATRYARAQGHEETALACAVAGADWQSAIEVLAAAAPGGFRGWSPVRLHEHLARLPESCWGADPQRRILVAFAAAISGDRLLAAEVIHQTPVAVSAPVPWWPALAQVVLALAARHPGRSQAAYRAAVAALSALTALTELAALDPDTVIPPLLGTADRDALAATAHLLAARAALFDGDPAGVRRHLDAGWAGDAGRIPRYAVLHGLGTDALACAWAGSFAAAGRRGARAGRLAAQAGLADHPLIGLVLLAGVEVLRARGRTDQALAQLDAVAPALRRGEAFVAAASGGQPQIAAERILRATLLLDRAHPPDTAAAAAELDLLTAEGDDDLPLALEAARAVTLARLRLRCDDVSGAESALRGAPSTAAVAATRVAVALQRHSPEVARVVLANWPSPTGATSPTSAESPDSRLRLLLSTAAVALALDRRPEAARGIEEALAVAEPEGHVQVFLDAPAPVRLLTSVVLRRAPAGSDWREQLAGRLDEVRLSTDAGSVPVTRRELAVLERLTTPLTHAQIASGMFVSENTLKSHCRNLYRKLGVNSRADAVRAARARGWLDPSPGGDVVLDVNITPTPAVVEL